MVIPRSIPASAGQPGHEKQMQWVLSGPTAPRTTKGRARSGTPSRSQHLAQKREKTSPVRRLEGLNHGSSTSAGLPSASPHNFFALAHLPEPSPLQCMVQTSETPGRVLLFACPPRSNRAPPRPMIGGYCCTHAGMWRAPGRVSGARFKRRRAVQELSFSGDFLTCICCPGQVPLVWGQNLLCAH